MDNGLCIKRIDSVYHIKSDDWKRPFLAPRLKDGVVFMLDGINRYTFPSEQVTAKRNDIIILPAKIPYSGVSFSEGVFEGIVIDFECCEGANIGQMGLPYVITVSDYELFRELNGVTNEKIPVILEYINKNLNDKNLSVSSICKKFFVSESTLMRNIQKLTGYSPSVYINLQRLEKAREYILNSDKSVKEIATICGFASPYYFSNSFKKKFGVSPRNYKRLNGGT